MVQPDRTQKRVFVLGVYASAVHAQWVGPDGRRRVGALGVASEPEIFWRGSLSAAQAIVSAISVPAGAGRLEAASEELNGPSGKALDDLFLAPLGFGRGDAWLCDLVPHSCLNPKQEAALHNRYDPMRHSLGLPQYNWPRLPEVLADTTRRNEIIAEIAESKPDLFITLGDLPLKWFAVHFGAEARLGKYGRTRDTYGRRYPIRIADRSLQLLPLVHPRQAARLGAHSAAWADLHQAWVNNGGRPVA